MSAPPSSPEIPRCPRGPRSRGGGIVRGAWPSPTHPLLGSNWAGAAGVARGHVRYSLRAMIVG